MSKNEFLSALGESLSAYSDLSDEIVERQLGQFERYFSRLSDEEAQTAIADFDSAEIIAANIYALVKEKERRKSACSGEAQAAPRKHDYDHTASDFTVMVSRSEGSADATATYDAVGRDAEHNKPPSVEEGGDSVPDISGGETINLDRVKPQVERIRATERKSEATQFERSGERPYDEPYYDEREFGGAHLDFSSFDDTPTQTSPFFWVLFALTFPLWGTVSITVLALFLLGFAALASLIVALVAVMIGIAAAGTGLSLFGIIYGITQTFDVFSAGLFEIGLGVAIGGTSMFIGIAVYNIAIRFLPFVIKKLTVFLRFCIRSASRLFLRIKKECAVQ